MPKFLNAMGRLNLSLILILCGLGNLVGMVLTHTHPRFGSGFRIAGTAITLATGITLLALAVYLQHSLPTSRDLFAAATAERESEERSRARRRATGVQHLKFRELSTGMKIASVLLLLLGGLLALTGIAHIFGFLSQLQFQSIGGRPVMIPRWASGGTLLLSGLMIAGLSLPLRIRYVDLWDEGLKKLLGGRGQH